MGLWFLICLSFWYNGINLVLLCMYSIISDVTQCSFDIQCHLLVVKCRWHLVFHVFVNRCNQEGVGILLLLHIYCGLQSIFVFCPSHLECVHHFPNFPLSPAAFFACFHPVLTFTVLQPDSILGRAGTKHTSCSQQSQMVCVCNRQWLTLVPNTGLSGFYFCLALRTAEDSSAVKLRSQKHFLWGGSTQRL